MDVKPTVDRDLESCVSDDLAGPLDLAEADQNRRPHLETTVLRSDMPGRRVVPAPNSEIESPKPRDDGLDS